MTVASRVAVVGAGIAGLACGRRLHDAGVAVTLFDKGRRPGGRLATRRSEWGAFDHGAASFAASDASLHGDFARWVDAGVLVPDPELPGAWMGTPSMNALPAALAAGLDLHAGVRVAAIERDGAGWRLTDEHGAGLGAFDAVVVAVPAEQAVPLLAGGAPALAQALAGVHSESSWTVMAAWGGDGPQLATPLLGPLCDRPDSTAPVGPLACVRREDTKPGRDRGTGVQRWVLSATPYWSAHNLDLDPADVVRHLLDDLARRSTRPVGAPLHAVAHRWRYAEVPQPLPAPCGWDAAAALGACGDAWYAGGGVSSVERAWRSGRALAERLLAPVAAPGR